MDSIRGSPPMSRCRRQSQKEEGRILMQDAPFWLTKTALLFGSLIVGVHFFTSLIQDALYLSSVGAGRCERQILLVRFFAIRRENDAVRLGIYGGVRNQSLSLDVIQDGLVRISSERRIGGRYLCRTIPF